MLVENTARRAADYAKLKLAGLRDAPVQLAVFADAKTGRGHGLGLGWISILDPVAATKTLEVPDGWRLIAYLCIGWPEEEHDHPELERAGWQESGELDEFLFRR